MGDQDFYAKDIRSERGAEREREEEMFKPFVPFSDDVHKQFSTTKIKQKQTGIGFCIVRTKKWEISFSPRPNSSAMESTACTAVGESERDIFSVFFFFCLYSMMMMNNVKMLPEREFFFLFLLQCSLLFCFLSSFYFMYYNSTTTLGLAVRRL